MEPAKVPTKWQILRFQTEFFILLLSSKINGTEESSDYLAKSVCLVGTFWIFHILESDFLSRIIDRLSDFLRKFRLFHPKSQFSRNFCRYHYSDKFHCTAKVPTKQLKFLVWSELSLVPRFFKPLRRGFLSVASPFTEKVCPPRGPSVKPSPCTEATPSQATPTPASHRRKDSIYCCATLFEKPTTDDS